MASLLLAATLAGLYLAVLLRQPVPAGPDVAYYLIGAEHLRNGRWPWGSEPPLPFLALLPFTLVLSGPAAYACASSLCAGLVLYLLGQVCAELYARRFVSGQPFGRQPAPEHGGGLTLATVLGVVLGAGYMVPAFVNCVFRNSLANLFVLWALLNALRRRPLLALLCCGLAVLSHPGVVAPLVLAMLLAVAADRGAIRALLGGAAERLRAIARNRAERRWIWPALVAALFLASGLLWACWPTLARYGRTYLGPQAGTVRGAFGQWDALTLILHYLPLWPLAALFWAVPAARGQVLSARWLAGALGVWALLLPGFGTVGGLVSRRFEVQLFIPLSIMAACYLAARRPVAPGREPAGRGGRKARVAWGLGASVAVVFGLAILWTSIGTPALLTAGQVQALSDLDLVLPPDAKLVVFESNSAYWAEYYARRPVIGPHLLPERARRPGPLFILTQDPARADASWPAETLAGLRREGLVVWERETFLLLRGRDDREWLASWRQAPTRPAIELLAGELPGPLPEPPSLRRTTFDAAAAWLLFAPLGVASAAGLPPALAFLVGLPLSVAVHLVSAKGLLALAKGLDAGRRVVRGRARPA